MKRILLIVVIFVGFVGTLFAGDGYDRRWREVQRAVQNDLPATALSVLGDIRSQAQREGNDAQLLRAMLTAATIRGEVSADSLAPAWTEIEAYMRAETRPVEAALWHCAVGLSPCLVTDAAQRYDFMAKALADMPSLSRKSAGQYLPLFVSGADSQAFGDDVLHVIGYAIADCLERDYTLWQFRAAADTVRQRLADFYAEHGTRSAALMSALRVLANRHGDVLADLRRLADQYADLPEAVEAYILMSDRMWDNAPAEIVPSDSLRRAIIAELEAAAKRYRAAPRAKVLRNFLSRIKNPSISLHAITGDKWLDGTLPSLFVPGDTLRVVVRRQNVGTFALRFEPLEPNVQTLHQMQQGEVGKCKARAKAIVRRYNLPRAEAPYLTLRDTVTITVPDSGLYRLTLVHSGARGESVPVYVSPHRVILLHAPGGADDAGTSASHTYLAVVDSRTGHPVEGAVVGVYPEADASGTVADAMGAVADAMGTVADTMGAVAGEGAFLPVRTCVTDAEGRALIDFGAEASYRHYVLAVTNRDAATHPLVSTSGRGWRSNAQTSASLDVRLYLDRGIYRPGQKVHFGGLVYTRRGDETIAAAKSLEIILRDANYREIDRVVVRSDSTGNFGGVFTLPEHCLTGTFSISCKQPMVTQRFAVEAYRRPTFEVNIQEPSAAYALGDTLRLRGTAYTLTDLPIGGARVQYRCQDLWRGDKEVMSGESLTDEHGAFGFDVILPCNDESMGQMHRDVWRGFVVTVTVTSPDGESIEAKQYLHASARRSIVTISCPTVLCREHLGENAPEIVVRHTNVAGKSLGGSGKFTLSRITETGEKAYCTADFVADKPLARDVLAALPSGKYRLRAEISDSDAPFAEATFSIFGEYDTRLAHPAPHFEYICPSALGDSVTLMLGTSCQDTYIYYDLSATSGYTAHRTFVMSDTLVHETLTWRPEYGDGATAIYAFVRDGRLYTSQISVQRPRPNKALRWRWETFRDRLQPGQHEEWRLSLRYADGTPADAVVMARLYDASLDALRQYRWTFGHNFGRAKAYLGYQFPTFDTYLAASGKFEPLRETNLRYTHWRKSIFDYYASRDGSAEREIVGNILRPKLYARAEVASNKAMISAPTAQNDNFEAADVAEEAGAEHDAVRSDFSETAFFFSALRTDTFGVCTIAFTLPESLTQWRLNVLAHDKNMNFALVENDIVARRLLMAEAKVPRFVRVGDKISLPVTVTRLVEEDNSDSAVTLQPEPEKIVLSVVIAEAESGRVLRRFERKICLAPGKSLTENFVLEAPDDCGALTITVKAASERYIDGEQRTIAVLGDEIMVQRTVPFSLETAGKYDISLQNLWGMAKIEPQQLTVEATSHPIWSVIAALPTLIQTTARSADDWATRLYCLTIAEYLQKRLPEGWIDSLAAEPAADKWGEILRRNPELKAVLIDESPWALHAEREAERLRCLRNLMSSDFVESQRWTAIDRLRAMQLGQGAWQWFPGMGESRSATLDVLTLLMRMQKMTEAENHTPVSRHAEAISAMIDAAMSYLGAQIAEDVRQIRRTERRDGSRYSPSEAQIRYLYLCTLCPDERRRQALLDSESARYLLDCARNADPKSLTMFGKSVLAAIFAASGDKTSAQTMVQSLLEFTVYDPTMGRYFDTKRAFSGWASYRIPTQVGVIEALNLVESSALRCGEGSLSRTDALRQLRQWLLQSRRTQIWETSRQSSDAIYALLTADEGVICNREPVRMSLSYRRAKSLPIDAEVQGAKTIGYQRKVLQDSELLLPQSLAVEIASDGVVWGAVYAEGLAPADAVEVSGSGMSLARSLEVLRGNRWETADSRTHLAVGDRVRQVLRLRAERDYDFVCLDFGRASTLESVTKLSGMRLMNGVWCYLAPSDVGTKCFVEHLAKGEYTFVDEAFVERTGSALLPPAHVQCVYAPEFGAMTGAMRLVVGE